MPIEARTPQNREDIPKLALELMQEFSLHGLVLDPDSEFGGLSPDSFGFNVDDDVKKVNLGFLQIKFEPEGWTGIAPQNQMGIKSLTALAIALGRNPEEMRLTELAIKYSMFQTYFPYKTAQSPTSD